MSDERRYCCKTEGGPVFALSDLLVPRLGKDLYECNAAGVFIPRQYPTQPPKPVEPPEPAPEEAAEAAGSPAPAKKKRSRKLSDD